MPSSLLLSTHFLLPSKDRISPSFGQSPLKNPGSSSARALSTWPWKWRCRSSAQEQPSKQQQQQKKPPRRPLTKKSEPNADPVGFLSKKGISDRAFAQFLRERHKAYKDRKFELFSRFIDLKEASAGYEILGMHRHREHRVDYMEWAPGNADFPYLFLPRWNFQILKSGLTDGLVADWKFLINLARCGAGFLNMLR